MKELLEFMVRGLVDDVQAVSVQESSANGQLTYRIAVAPADIGKVIGRQGRTVKALRAVAAAMEKKTGQRAVVEIAE
ncbi:MAG TPA: KH domain-containing protein [Myxococcales bacterium]|nr:KH domain-containing protein [Myxococcales bacterium]